MPSFGLIDLRVVNNLSSLTVFISAVWTFPPHTHPHNVVGYHPYEEICPRQKISDLRAVWTSPARFI